MIARNFALSCFFLGSLAFALSGKVEAASTAPGTYRNWNGEIDEVTIVQPFRLDSYSDIAVESFDITGLTLPNPQENTFAAVQKALRSLKSAFIEGFRESLRQKPGPAIPRQGKAETLVIIARVIKADPGSQAARAWGFGAGAVKVAITGEIVDARSRKVLIRFRQERYAGFGLFGGGYGKLFDKTAHQIGVDIAELLNAF